MSVNSKAYLKSSCQNRTDQSNWTSFTFGVQPRQIQPVLATRSRSRTLFFSMKNKEKHKTTSFQLGDAPNNRDAPFCYVHHTFSVSRISHEAQTRTPKSPYLCSLISPPATAPLVSGFSNSPPFVALHGAISSPRRRTRRLWWFSSPQHPLFWSPQLCFSGTCLNFLFSCFNFLSFIFVSEGGVLLLAYFVCCFFNNEGGDYVCIEICYAELYCSVIRYVFSLIIKYCIVVCYWTIVYVLVLSTLIVQLLFLDAMYFIMLMFLNLEYGWPSLHLLLWTLFVIWNIRYFKFGVWIDHTSKCSLLSSLNCVNMIAGFGLYKKEVCLIEPDPWRHSCCSPH